MVWLYFYKVLYILARAFGLDDGGVQIGFSPKMAFTKSHGTIAFRTTKGTVTRRYFMVDKRSLLFKPSDFVKYELLRQCMQLGIKPISIDIVLDSYHYHFSESDLGLYYARKVTAAKDYYLLPNGSYLRNEEHVNLHRRHRLFWKNNVHCSAY